MKNKAAKTKLAVAPEPPAFQIAIRKRGASAKAAAASPKPEKRDNIFSKSRDSREDRGMREMKTSHNAQTLPHTH